jgi:hypothetical protein
MLARVVEDQMPENAARPAGIADHRHAQAFALVAACCRRPLDAQVVAAVRAAAETADWPAVLGLAARHRVEGLVDEALAAAGIDGPPPVAARLTARAHDIARGNLAMAAEIVRIQRAFDAAGIPMLMLKGVALAQLAYGAFTRKHNRDIDLYVPRTSALAAMQRLEAEGYALAEPKTQLTEAQQRMLITYAREAVLVHRDKRHTLELHWQFTDNPRLLDGIGAMPATQEVALIPGSVVRTLNHDDLFAYLCVHGASHSWSRLKWLADLNALQARGSDAEIVRLYRHAQAHGAGLCAGQSLLLCRDVFARRLPAALENELTRSTRVRQLVRIAHRAMRTPEADGGTRFSAKTRAFFTSFLLGEGVAFVAAQCRIVSIGLADALRYPLPRRWHFLYLLLRVPSWLWRYARTSITLRGNVRPRRDADPVGSPRRPL